MTTVPLTNKSNYPVQTTINCLNTLDNFQLPTLSAFKPSQSIVTSSGFSNDQVRKCDQFKDIKYYFVAIWAVEARNEDKPLEWAVFDNNFEIVKSDLSKWSIQLKPQDDKFHIYILNGSGSHTIPTSPGTSKSNLTLIIISSISILLLVLLIVLGVWFATRDQGTDPNVNNEIPLANIT